jgi:hypothetical protein
MDPGSRMRQQPPIETVRVHDAHVVPAKYRTSMDCGRMIAGALEDVRTDRIEAVMLRQARVLGQESSGRARMPNARDSVQRPALVSVSYGSRPCRTPIATTGPSD